MIHAAANRGDGALGYFAPFAREREFIGDTLFPEPGNADFDVDDIFEFDGAAIFAVSRDARPTDRALVVAGEHAEAQVAEQFVLGLFHHGEEYRKVHDAGRVGIAEFNRAGGGERGGHGGVIRRQGSSS